MDENNEVNTISKVNKFKLSPKELIFKYIIYLPLFVISVGICITIAYIYL